MAAARKPKNSQGKTASVDGFEAAREAILPLVLENTAFDGWTSRMLENAARAADIDSPTLHAAFPGGVRDVIRYWSAQSDAAMTEAMIGTDFAALKIREKVTFAVLARLDELRPHKEAARRAAGYLALPPNAALGAKLSWQVADAIWCGLGDQSTDINFYSKRAILSGVWTSTFARWLADETEGETATKAFLDARISNVMQIEKVKAQIRKTGFDPAKPVEFLARLRYPSPR